VRELPLALVLEFAILCDIPNVHRLVLSSGGDQGLAIFSDEQLRDECISIVVLAWLL